VEDAYRIYFAKDGEGRKAVFNTLIECDTTWSNSISNKAKSSGIPFEQARENALQEVVRFDTASVFSEKSIQEVISQIKANPEWYAKVRVKSVENNKALQEMLRLEALWMINNRERNHIQRYWPINWR